MKNVLIICLTILVTSCGSQHENEYEIKQERDELIEKKPLTEKELKQQLVNTECDKGTSYLDGKLGYEPIYKNLISMKVKGLKINCDIKNKATLVTLKDIKINVKFISKTGSTILSKEFTIREYIRPA